ncbi:MAG: Threonine--tRNA ligase [Syntrophaceae bacterium PtaU1.Bin231]|nr:MAG: Threonine--tRNA ligase [Syntrophaceae bacterium PtaU1.Bin231]
MASIGLKYPDGSERSLPAETTARDAIAAWKPELLSSAVAASLNGRAIDLSSTLNGGGELSAIDAASKEGLSILRHSISHVMAQAVQDSFEKVQVSIGPSIEDGFYYDFDYDRTFTPEDLARIEKRMKEIAAADYPFRREEVPREKAVELFRERGEGYKVELLRDLPEDVKTVSLYRQGGYVDLCRGPHIPSTGMIRAFKLLSVAAGAGLAIFHPKGMMLRWIIEDWERREHLKRGYDMVMGPQILKVDLWKRSGHYEHYRENMYFTEVEGQAYGIKPMNCLAHMLIYKSKIRSYRDLPLRYFELGTVHRHEKTGVLHGLLRVRQFTQDDAHILCTPEQLNAEIRGVADFVAYAMKIFGFEYEVELSTRPENSIGTDADWELATSALRAALEDNRIPYEVNEGDGAFYGPKIDFKLKDALKRKWQCATIQCDFTLPERFDLTYMAADGERRRPVMLHRVILGAIERFLGVLIEHYAGALPVWLSPVQARLITVTDRQIPYGEEVYAKLAAAGVRVEKDFDNQKLGYKIREAQMQKIPYMLVIGDREAQEGKLAPRLRDGKNLGSVSVDEFIAIVRDRCAQYQ